MFFVVPIPLNEKREGPEMDPSLIFCTVYQIWDENFLLVATYETEEEALYQASILNEEYRPSV